MGHAVDAARVGQGVQGAGGSQALSPVGSSPSTVTFIIPRTATCQVRTPSAFRGHGAFLVEVASEQLSLSTSYLLRKSLWGGCQEEPM